MATSPVPVSMKNTPTAAEPSAAWSRALEAFALDLVRRGAAEKTRRAYAVDLRELARWAGAAGVEPAAVTLRVLRRYAAGLSERGLAPATVARKLAALRAFFRALVEHGTLEQNPADLLTAPRRAQRLPRVLRPDEVAALLDRIPATTPLELRDRALFELAYACGLRAEELVSLDAGSVDFDAERVRVEGKGGQDADRAGRRARAGRARALPRHAPGRRSRSAPRSSRCSSRSPAGASRPPTSGAGCAGGPGSPPCAAAPTRMRCGTPSRPICSRAAPTCARSRSCSVTRASPRPRSTLG